MSSIADFVILSDGWRRRLLAFASGAVGALALAPFNILPAMIVPMTVAVWLIDGMAESKPDALRGFRKSRQRNKGVARKKCASIKGFHELSKSSLSLFAYAVRQLVITGNSRPCV